MSLRILLYCFLIPFCWSSVNGNCEITNFHDDCQYTVYCWRNPGTVHTYNCKNEPNVTFVVKVSKVKHLGYNFFSKTNFDQRVRHLIAIGNNWDVIEPNTFKYYRKTISMDLSQNRIIDIKNEAFYELVMLKHLNLSNNMIEYLQDKSLQIGAGSENVLEVLDLSNNLLISIGSNVFSSVANLKKLLLHNNNIIRMASDCFSVLKYITVLTLNNNKITKLNTTLVAMSGLKYLDLSKNLIDALLGIEMDRAVSLTHLNISQNAIEFVEPNCFNQALNLETVDLSHNRISTLIEEQMFSYNKKLTYLNFYHNNIKTLGDNVFKSAKLNYLNIDNNNVTGDITNNTFTGLQNITYLNITHQHIKSIRNNAFSAMTNLQHLDLSHNDIEVVENFSFVNTSALIVLKLSHNFIKHLDFLKMFSSNLTDFYVNNNNISVITEFTFSNHASIRELDLSVNIITSIEPNALPINNIQFLNLKNNNLSGTLVDKVFSSARLLEHLDLSQQNLRAINNSAFENLPLLETLDLSDNNIQYVDSNNFKGLNSMYVFDISKNNLTELNINFKLRNLETLLISKNKLTCVPNILKLVNSSNFINLDISYNNIFNVNYSGFKNLTNLLTLNLSHNNISYFNNQYTNTLATLLVLNLDSNHLKEINLTYFKNIMIVKVCDNNIASLDVSQFQNLSNLMTLELRANNIKEILPGTFQYLTSLKTLILSKNNITYLRFGTFRGLNDTNVIDLSYNKIKTIPVDIFHECHHLRNIIIDYNNISSVDIERLVEVSSNLESISLGGNPIACEEIVKNSIKSFNVRNFEITSLHKIYHENNVHGIKCGENSVNFTSAFTTEAITTMTSDMLDLEKGDSSSVVLLVWCSVITVLLVVGLVYMYLRYRTYTINSSDTRMQLPNSVSSRNSECVSDLLS